MPDLMIEDYLRIETMKKLLPQQPQHQGSVQTQLVILREAANRLGLYDAADHLSRSTCLK